jgi:hypothetical protein
VAADQAIRRPFCSILRAGAARSWRLSRTLSRWHLNRRTTLGGAVKCCCPASGRRSFGRARSDLCRHQSSLLAIIKRICAGSVARRLGGSGRCWFGRHRRASKSRGERCASMQRPSAQRRLLGHGRVECRTPPERDKERGTRTRLDFLAAAIKRSISAVVRYSRVRTEEFTVFGGDRPPVRFPTIFARVRR